MGDASGLVGKLVPTAWIEQASEMTDQEAQDYKDKVVWAFDLKRSIYYGLVVTGMLVASLAIGLGIFVGRQDEGDKARAQQPEGWQQPLIHPNADQNDDREPNRRSNTP